MRDLTGIAGGVLSVVVLLVLVGVGVIDDDRFAWGWVGGIVIFLAGYWAGYKRGRFLEAMEQALRPRPRSPWW